MSDQLSKVVAEMRSWDSKVEGYPDAQDLNAWADRIESAAQLPIPAQIGSKSVDAAPVEVDDEANKNALYVEHCAEKLCEAGARVKGNTLVGIATYIRTLAHQLAEAKAENERLLGLNSQLVKKSNTQVVELARMEERLEQAESQLAEATRLLQEWRDWHNDNSGWIKPTPLETTDVFLSRGSTHDTL